MDVREKMIEILRKPIFPHELVDPTEAVADYLLDNGVTVQDGKPLDAFLHPVDTYKGLKAKYLVFKADTGERVGNCFVLRPDKDPAAVEAIRAYARATDNETLADDIYNWVGKGEPVKEWISVDDRLPEQSPNRVDEQGRSWFTPDIDCIVYDGENVFAAHYCFQNKCFWYADTLHPLKNITHWMPIPQPPKGE